MAGTGTATASFTVTDARYVGAKISADLRLLSSLYGLPKVSDIDSYAEEIALLLRDGYLNTVDYGFRDTATNDWKLRLRFTATVGGQLRNDRPGGIPTSAAASGCSWYSYLSYSAKFMNLSPAQQATVKTSLPISRSGAAEPTTGSGTTQSAHGYGRNGAGVTRDVYSAH